MEKFFVIEEKEFFRIGYSVQMQISKNEEQFNWTFWPGQKI